MIAAELQRRGGPLTQPDPATGLANPEFLAEMTLVGKAINADGTITPHRSRNKVVEPLARMCLVREQESHAHGDKVWMLGLDGTVAPRASASCPAEARGAAIPVPIAAETSPLSTRVLGCQARSDLPFRQPRWPQRLLGGQGEIRLLPEQQVDAGLRDARGQRGVRGLRGAGGVAGAGTAPPEPAAVF